MSAPAPGEGFAERLHVFGTKNYERSYLADVIKYGISVEQTLLRPDGTGLGSCIFLTDAGPVAWKREPDPNPPSTANRVSEPLRSPVTIVTGGHHQPAHPADMPQMVAPLSSLPQHASQASQPAPPQAAKLSGSLRRFKLWDISKIQAESVQLGIERFLIAVELGVLESFEGWPDQWHCIKHSVVDDDGENITFFLCPDSGGGSDSSVFCNIPWVDLPKLSDGRSTDESVYNHKNKVPAPPLAEIEDKTQLSELSYGLPGGVPFRLRLYQTLVNLTLARRSDVPTTTVFDFPLGVITGVGGPGLENIADGILGLGRSDNIHTGYGADVRFKSESFHAALFARKIIGRPVFYISLGHDKHDTIDSDSHYISFGVHVTPAGRVDKQGFTAIDVLGEKQTQYRGKWTVFLDEIIIRYADQGRRSDHIRVRANVIVDSGATQTYLPSAACIELTSAMKEIGAPEDGFCGKIDPKDEVVLVFGSKRVSAEARRFLESPLSPLGVTNQIPLAIKPSSSKCLLGVNLFRAFVVGFDEFDKPCVWLRARASNKHRAS